MSELPKFVIFSSIGSVMRGDVDPIYEIAHRFPPAELNLFTSDEPPEKGRESSFQNIEYIRQHFTKAKVPVTDEALRLDEYEKNVYHVAGSMIDTYLKYAKDCQLLIDISAGRGVIRQVLSRAAEIAIDTIHTLYDSEYYIIGAIRSRNQPIVDYRIGSTGIPDRKDAELLFLVDQNWTQTKLARELEWNNQSEVSKAMKRLEAAGLIIIKGHKSRILTPQGKYVKNFLKAIFERE